MIQTKRHMLQGEEKWSINEQLFVTLNKHWLIKGDSVQRTYLQCRRLKFHPWVSKIPWRRKWQPTSLFLPGKSQGQRSLVGYSPWGRKRVAQDLVTSSVQFSSVQFSRSVMSDSLWPHESQHARPPCPSPTPGVHSNSCPSSLWCHPAISSSVVPFSSCPHSLPASGSFPMSQLFAWGGQSTGVSTSASVLPMNTQDWSPLGWTGWISLQSKGLSSIFSSTTVQKHQFFSAQLSL